MISAAYIHEYDPLDQFMYESHYILLDAKDAEQHLISLESSIEEKIYFGENVEGERFFLEAEKKNVFTRIGEAIIQIFNSFVDAITSIGKSIKDSITGIRKKASTDNMKKAMQNDPELAKQFLNAVMSGNISAHDVKDLNELLDEATKISNELMTGKIDSKKFGDKIDSALEKWGNTAKSIAGILGLITTGVTAYKGISDIKNAKGQKRREQMSGELKFRNELNKIEGLSNEEREKRLHEFNNTYGSKNKFKDESKTESVMMESVSWSPIEILSKVTNFFSSHLSSCNSAINKMNELKETVLAYLKKGGDKASETCNAFMEGIRKIMGAITKELNTIKNSSHKFDEKLKTA